MKKLSILAATAVSAVAIACSLSGCAFDTTHYSANVSGTLYSKGEQTITLPSSEEYPEIKFEESLTASDFSFGDGWGDKKITSVTFVSKDEVKLTISGTMSVASSEDYGYYLIHVADHALTGTSTAEYTARVVMHAPRMTAGSCLRAISGGVGMFHSSYSLPYGSFIAENCTAANIKTENGKGTVTAKVEENGTLYVEVKDYEVATGEEFAKITIAANCTTFNIPVTIEVGNSNAKVDLL